MSCGMLSPRLHGERRAPASSHATTGLPAMAASPQAVSAWEPSQSVSQNDCPLRVGDFPFVFDIDAAHPCCAYASDAFGTARPPSQANGSQQLVPLR